MIVYTLCTCGMLFFSRSDFEKHLLDEPSHSKVDSHSKDILMPIKLEKVCEADLWRIFKAYGIDQFVWILDDDDLRSLSEQLKGAGF